MGKTRKHNKKQLRRSPQKEKKMAFFKYNDYDVIRPHLLLGNVFASRARNALRKEGVTHVISLINGFVPPYPDDVKKTNRTFELFSPFFSLRGVSLEVFH